MAEPTIILADCGCRFKAVANLPKFDTGSLALVNPCVAHSQARTKYLEGQKCGCMAHHQHTRRGLCIDQGCQDCNNDCANGGCCHG